MTTLFLERTSVKRMFGVCILEMIMGIDLTLFLSQNWRRWCIREDRELNPLKTEKNVSEYVRSPLTMRPLCGSQFWMSKEGFIVSFELFFLTIFSITFLLSFSTIIISGRGFLFSFFLFLTFLYYHNYNYLSTGINDFFL